MVGTGSFRRQGVRQSRKKSEIFTNFTNRLISLFIKQVIGSATTSFKPQKQGLQPKGTSFLLRLIVPRTWNRLSRVS